MPLYEHLMAALKKQYGAKRGKVVYYSMRSKGKPPFKSRNDG